MQGYSYSVFSLAAIAIHLLINFKLLAGLGVRTERGKRYRDFLLAVLVYYVADGAWGLFAGLGWNRFLYADTILYFLSLAAFILVWCRFVAVYLGFGTWPKRILAWAGCAILVANVALLAANVSTEWVFGFDEDGKYLTGFMRDPLIGLLVNFTVLTAVFALAKVLGGRDADRRRAVMVLLFCVTVAAAIVLQILWPLTPYTSLGCLICSCFFNVFVVQDEQATKHTAELEGALARVREAEKARSMFFSIVSHDIRTPLNAILGYSELILKGLGTQAEKADALKSIHANGSVLLKLVEDVLDLSKMDSGKLVLRVEPMQLSRVTDEVFATVRLAAAAKGVALVNRTADVPTVLLDTHRFRQVLFNLVGNAVKFTERGSVTVSATYAGKTLEIAVADTGCGIPPDVLPRIFDPFVQAQDPTHTADRTGGTGLGLSISKSLVEVMGGEISVKTELGKGSTFTVRIPGVETRAEEPAPAAKPEPADAGENKPKHVLVVDDSPVNRAVLTAHLKKAGITAIDQACDGGEALVKLGSAVESGNPHDFVFSDLWMPNVNGRELIGKLRADSRFGGLPVFAVTADTEFRDDNGKVLFNGVLFKPLTYTKLVEIFSEKQEPEGGAAQNAAQ
jgi:signal transduction histidine kinase